MRKIYKNCLGSLIVLLLISITCGAIDLDALKVKTDLDTAYGKAVVDARTAEENEISHHLVAITRSNKALVWDREQSHLKAGIHL